MDELAEAVETAEKIAVLRSAAQVLEELSRDPGVRPGILVRMGVTAATLADAARFLNKGPDL